MARRLVTRKNDEPQVPSRESRLRAMEALTKTEKSFRPAGEVLTLVRSVPTIFAQYDHAVGVWGHPIERVTVIHGPSNNGKTIFGLGLGLSFLQHDHYFKLMDAEHTTSIDWPAKLMGEYVKHPGFVASRPSSYEEAVDDVRDFVLKIDKQRTAGDLPDDMTALILVDSIRKLVPKNFFTKVLGEGAKKGSKANGVDGFGGRGAQIKAAMNAAWLDELTPLLYKTKTAIAFIARESEDTDADANDRKYGNDYKVGGGKALIFDSSLVIRIERSRWVQKSGKDDDTEDEKKNRPVYGEKHRITVKKTKVAGKTDKTQVAFFYTSNGVLVPEGFDTARDLIDLGTRFEIVTKSGAWFKFGNRKWQGEDAAVKGLTADSVALKELDYEVRTVFARHNPIEEDS